MTRIFAFTLISLSISGCSSMFGPVTVKNFRETVEIKKIDKTFATGHSLIGTKECFPNLTKPICRTSAGEKIFEIESVFDDIAQYEITYSSRDGFNKEYLYLIAAELAIQEGYPMFTPLTEQLTARCTKDQAIKSFATFNSLNNIGNGSVVSYVEDNSNCLLTMTLTTLYFKDKKPLTQGLLSKQNSGIAQTSNFYPVIDLYRGTTPNLPSYRDISNNNLQLIYTYFNEAWRSHYDPTNTSVALSKKLGAPSSQSKLKIRDLAVEERSQDSKILNTLKITN